jgi:GNAT superfamily N-acetyltransferase
MFLKKEEVPCIQIKFSIVDVNEREIARASIIIGKNELHDKQFGFMEDVFVVPDQRGKGYMSKVVKQVLAEAKRRECYKVIATARDLRPEVHDIYLHYGFKNWGREFRMDL